MRAFSRSTPILAAALLVVGCQPASDGLAYDDAALNTENQKASYSLGLDFGRQLEPAVNRIDMAALVRGIRDGMETRDQALTDEERQVVMNAFSEAVRAELSEAREAEAEANRAEGEAYLAENGARPEVTTTESGLQYEVLVQGDGATPSATDNVTIHYTGTLIDGTTFDSSREGPPATFNAGQVIAGFSEGLQLMQVGSTYRLVIPSDIAYGSGGSGQTIGPDKTLIFEIELLDVQPTG